MIAESPDPTHMWSLARMTKNSCTSIDIVKLRTEELDEDSCAIYEHLYRLCVSEWTFFAIPLQAQE